MRIAVAIVLISGAVFASESPSPQPSPVKKRKIIPMVEGHKLRSADEPLPHYPDEAKARGWTGKGIIILSGHSDGTVYDAKVFKSTGYDILDKEAIRAFRQWHFRPEKADFTAKVPCDFAIRATPTPSATPGT